MWNIYIKYLLSNLRNKSVILWNLAFPIVLATLFAFAFSGIDSGIQLREIPVGIVVNEDYEAAPYFKTAIDSMESEKVFSMVEFADEIQAKKALEKGDIKAYIQVATVSNELIPRLTVKENGIDQTIVKSFLDSYMGTSATVKNIMENAYYSSKGGPINGDPVNSEISRIVSNAQNQSFTEEVSLTTNKPTYMVTYFYALLAMTCMYGAFGGIAAIVNTGGNLSVTGARNLVSGTKKSSLTFAYMLSSVTSLFTSIMMVLAYVLLILKIDFGGKLGYVILTCFVGSVFGIGLGTAICSIPRIKETTMVGIVITVSMLSCFLAGMMNRDMAYLTLNKMPMLAAINPATRISDAFYCLYCYDSPDRFWANILAIAIMTGILFGIGVFSGRKLRYDSI